MNLDEIKNTIVVEAERLAGRPIEDYDQEILLKSDYIDSLNMINLVIYLEQKYEIEIDAFFVDRESVGSVNTLAESIYSKLEDKERQ